MLSNILGPLTSDPTPIDDLFLSLYPLDALLETSLALPIITQYVLQYLCKLQMFHVVINIQTKDPVLHYR